jgi:hypothetical protein
MIADTSVTPQYVMNVRTGEIGLLNGVSLSPYTFEALDGIERAHVTVFIPSSSGAMFESSDYWLPEDCIAVPNAAISVGATVTFITKRGTPRAGIVLAVEQDQLCAMLPSGQFGWVYMKYVVAVKSPLVTQTALAIAV